MPEWNRHFDALQTELEETVQLLAEATGNPRLRLKLLRKMRELLDEADRNIVEQLKTHSKK